ELEARTCVARRSRLAKPLRKAGRALHLNEHIDEPGEVVFRHACKLGVEGVVSKRLGSSYRSGRSKELAQNEKPGSTRGDAGGRGRLGAEGNDVDGQDQQAAASTGFVFWRKKLP